MTDALRMRLARFLAGHTQNRTDRGTVTAGCACGHTGDWQRHYADRAQLALLGASMVDGQRVLAERLADEYRKGRQDAADAIAAHRDTHAPADGNAAQKTLRRHLDIAIRVASPEPTGGEITAAIQAGNYAVTPTRCWSCYAAEHPAEAHTWMDSDDLEHAGLPFPTTAEERAQLAQEHPCGCDCATRKEV